MTSRPASISDLFRFVTAVWLSFKSTTFIDSPFELTPIYFLETSTFDSFNDDDHHDHDSPGQRISSPDFVDVEIPHAAGIASSRKPTPPSVPIVSMQDSNSATTPRAGAGARWEPVIDWTTAMRVSCYERTISYRA
jgi:hypothetical protein